MLKNKKVDDCQCVAPPNGSYRTFEFIQWEKRQIEGYLRRIPSGNIGQYNNYWLKECAPTTEVNNKKKKKFVCARSFLFEIKVKPRGFSDVGFSLEALSSRWELEKSLFWPQSLGSDKVLPPEIVLSILPILWIFPTETDGNLNWLSPANDRCQDLFCFLLYNKTAFVE